MALSAYPGEMRTRIRVQEFRNEVLPGGLQRQEWRDVFNPATVIRCKWVNAHGDDAISAHAARLREPATLTLRYSPRITPRCRVLREDDPEPYEIISIDDVRGAHKWLEITVKRMVSA